MLEPNGKVQLTIICGLLLLFASLQNNLLEQTSRLLYSTLDFCFV